MHEQAAANKLVEWKSFVFSLATIISSDIHSSRTSRMRVIHASLHIRGTCIRREEGFNSTYVFRETTVQNFKKELRRLTLDRSEPF